MFKRKMTGLTLAEISVVILLFSLFMIVIYSTLDVGFKMWKIGEVKGDLQTRGEILVRRITMEIKNANIYAIVVNETTDPNSTYYSTTPYLCFDTASHNGTLQFDKDSGDLMWQGFIFYYALDDPDKAGHKILYRRYVPHNKSSPFLSTDLLNPQLAEPDIINTWILDRPPVSSLTKGETLTICTDVKRVDFSLKNDLVSMDFDFEKNIKNSDNSKVMVTGKNAVYRFTISTSVKPEN